LAYFAVLTAESAKVAKIKLILFDALHIAGMAFRAALTCAYALEFLAAVVAHILVRLHAAFNLQSE